MKVALTADVNELPRLLVKYEGLIANRAVINENRPNVSVQFCRGIRMEFKAGPVKSTGNVRGMRLRDMF